MNATAAIANHLNIAESLIKSIEEWANVLFVRFVSGRPRFVSKKVAQKKMNCIQVETSCERVVIDTESMMGYVIRPGYDAGNFWMIKKFDPKGVDIRMLDFSRVKGEQLADKPTDSKKSAEYEAVIAALSFSKPKLVAYGMPGDCRFPQGYQIQK